MTLSSCLWPAKHDQQEIRISTIEKLYKPIWASLSSSASISGFPFSPLCEVESAAATTSFSPEDIMDVVVVMFRRPIKDYN